MSAPHLQDQAASAALSSSANPRPNSNSILDQDGKLSSASAATSLKYAKPQDLPSYPSTGGVQLSSAGAAASLATHKKSAEPWRPQPIPAANRAALLAKDHKMDPLWEPQASAAGSKAAMMAHAHPKEVEPLQPKRAATNKAAPSAAYDTPEDTHKKALMAANAVTKAHNRRRSGSLPTQTATKSTQDSSWALKAATAAKPKESPRPIPTSDKFGSGDPGFEAARIQNIAKNNVNRQLYTSNPPVDIEVQEKNRQDTLRASAVAMAQKMYAIQQKHIDEAAGKPDSQALAASRVRSSTIASDTSGAGDPSYATSGAGYANLEEAARKLAQERLAKIGRDENAEYRSYYGQTSPTRSRLSMRQRRRASSTADDDSDEEQSRKIRSQMSIFQSKLADVDTKKRQQDRDNLLLIAHRNVDARISQMDDKIFQDTGKASPAQMEKWQKAAREKAQRDSDERMQHAGKVHIGGGKYFDQSELDAIARARLQPTLDEISDKAEKMRARDEEERMMRERREAQAATEKARSADTAAAVKLESEKQKQEERARKEEEKRLQRESTKQKDTKPGRFSAFLGRGNAPPTAETTTTTSAVPTTPATTTSSHDESLTKSLSPADGQTYHDAVTFPTPDSAVPVAPTLEPVGASSSDTQDIPAAPEPVSTDGRKSVENRRSVDEENELSASPSQSRVKSWMKGRFRSKSNAQKEGTIMSAVAEADVDTEKGKTVEKDDPAQRTESMRDVAMAGRSTTNETDDLYTAGREVSPERDSAKNNARSRSPSISSLSSSSSGEAAMKPPTTVALGTTETTEADNDTRGRSGFGQRLLKKIKPNKEKAKDRPASPLVKDATTDDEFEEARDHFEEEKLAPPPPLSGVTGENSTKKTLSPKGSRDRSRFTEDL